jgi:arginine decarboxylase
VLGSLERVVPLVAALMKYKEKASISFHVPGHKDGVGSSELARTILGDQVFAIDATELPGLDNLNDPQGPIRDAELLAARLYGTRESMFLVNGSTSGVLAMVLATCGPGQRIIVSRNSHRSVISGIILAGAEPLYVEPEFHPQFGIPLGIPPDRIMDALDRYSDAVAALLPNPNYYGITSDLKVIADEVHRRGKLLLIDEACGSHFIFSDEFPHSAIEVGADMCVQSMHKMAGSLTQSSILHVISDRIDVERVRSVLGMIQTSSPSYVLMASLDAARYQLEADHGMLIPKMINLCKLLRSKAQDVSGLTYTGDRVAGDVCDYRVDMTKIVMSLRLLGFTGYELGKALRDKYGIEVELEDLYNILIAITFGNLETDIEQLISCVAEIAASWEAFGELRDSFRFPGIPDTVMSPRDAVWSRWRQVQLCEAAGEVCADIVSPYPPGVPIICPGEVVTDDIVEYLCQLIADGVQIQGLRSNAIEKKGNLESFMLRVVDA